jgi:hypothetical protein
MRAWMLLWLLCGAGLGWPASGRAQTNIDFAAPSAWLCLPRRSDACSAPLTSTVVSAADGSLARRTYTPDPAAPIDCFYVYPTVSREPTPNADMTLGPEEERAAREQFARFGARCRTFAPLYRQTTAAAMVGEAPRGDPDLAYRDVLGAWRLYLAVHNKGRGVVLIGHSQGAHLLARLIAEEFDGKPIQRRLVSAILAGGDIQVPKGRDVGGTFQHIPLCRTADEAGCVIAYSSYLADSLPGPDAAFGGGADPGFTAACVNPAALRGAATLDPELLTIGAVATLLGTDLVENPGVVSGACTTAGDRTFLAISVKPAGPASASLDRALTALNARRPGWGLHALDINLTLGDLVEIVGRQGQAWRKPTP